MANEAAAMSYSERFKLEQDAKKEQLKLLAAFCEEHDGKYLTAWEIDRIEGWMKEMSWAGWVVTERIGGVIDQIFDKLLSRGLIK